MRHEDDGDYYLEIKSPAKELKETSMNRRFKEGFETEMQKAAVPENVDRNSGVYFLRTNVATIDEKTTWDYCNLTKEIEYGTAS